MRGLGYAKKLFLHTNKVSLRFLITEVSHIIGVILKIWKMCNANIMIFYFFIFKTLRLDILENNKIKVEDF